MHPRTVATLEVLDKAVWFSRVGVKATEVAIVLSSWEEAIEHCSSIEWENLGLEAANQYRERLVVNSKERFRKWNEIAEEVRTIAIPFVREKIDMVRQEYNLPEVFVNTVEWDIIHLCMEAEYADLCPPGYYAGLAYWYKAGHFPCGASGEFQQRKLVVY
jgi:hypothetical protein